MQMMLIERKVCIESSYFNGHCLHYVQSK